MTAQNTRRERAQASEEVIRALKLAGAKHANRLSVGYHGYVTADLGEAGYMHPNFVTRTFATRERLRETLVARYGDDAPAHMPDDPESLWADTCLTVGEVALLAFQVERIYHQRAGGDVYSVWDEGMNTWPGVSDDEKWPVRGHVNVTVNEGSEGLWLHVAMLEPAAMGAIAGRLLIIGKSLNADYPACWESAGRITALLES